MSSFLPESRSIGRVATSKHYSVYCLYHCSHLVHCFHQRHTRFIGKEKIWSGKEKMPVSERQSSLFISKDESRYLSLCVFVLTGGRPKIFAFHICANTTQLFKVTARNGLVFLPAFPCFKLRMSDSL